MTQLALDLRRPGATGAGGPLFVVPSERHVERLLALGYAARTPWAFEEHLRVGLLADVRVASPAEERLALAQVLASTCELEGSGPSASARVTAWTGALDALEAHADALDPGRVRGALAGRARLLAAITADLGRALARLRLIARRDLAAALAARVAASSPGAVAAACGAEVVEARLLVDLSPSRLGLFVALDGALSRLGGRASVCLPAFERGLDAARAQDPLERLAQWTAARLDAAPRTEPIPARLGHLDGGHVALDPARSTEVRIADDDDALAHAAADAVRDALARGAAVERVAVAVDGLDAEALRGLSRALGEAGVVAHTRDRAPSRLLGLATDLLRGDLSAHGVQRSLYVDRALDAEAIRGALARIPPEGTADELASAARAALRALGVGVVATGPIGGAFDRDDGDAIAALARRVAASDARTWEALESALAELPAAAATTGATERRFTRAELADELVAIASAGPLPGASRSFAVRIARLSELAAEELDLLVLVGSLAPPPAAHGLASVELLTALGVPAGLVEARASARVALAASRADRVVLVVPREGGGDAPEGESPLVASLLRAGTATSSFRVGSRLGAPLSARDARLAGYLAGASPPTACAEVERAREGFFLDPRRRRTATTGALPASEAIRRAVEEDTGAARPLAVTAIEHLATCPFRGYAHIVLGARSPEPEGTLPTARDEGARLHDALAAAFTAVRDLLARRPREPAEIERVGVAAAARLLDRPRDATVLEPLLARRALHAVRLVLREAAADEAWDHLAAEQAFGEASDGSWSALDLGEVEGAPLRARGRIDRVDTGRLVSATRVIDYKRGAVAETVRRVGETALQVPLYALAAQQATGAREASGAYYSLSERELGHPERAERRGVGVIAAAIAEGAAVHAARAAVARLRSLDLAPRPRSDAACHTCPLDGGCRRPRFTMPAEDDEVGGGPT